MRIPDPLYFELWQDLLVKAANTKAGRDLLGIDYHFPRIIHIRRDCIIGLHGYDRDRMRLRGRFHSRQPYADRIRRGWPEWLGLTSYFLKREEELANLWHLTGFSKAATTLSVMPDADPETSSFDGVAYHYEGGAGGVHWDAIHDGAGSGSYDSLLQGNMILIKSGTAGSGHWQGMHRAIMLFDTSALGADAVIDSATLTIESAGVIDIAGFVISANIYSSNPASNTAIANGDYTTLGTTAFSTAIAITSWAASGSDNDFDLNAAGIAAIPLTGIAKFGVRDATNDVPDTEPAWFSPGDLTEAIAWHMSDDTGHEPGMDVEYTAGISSLLLSYNLG